MTGPAETPRRESAFTLVRRLFDQAVGLAKLEVTHARQEVGEMVAGAGRGVLLLGIALALTFMALIALVMVLILAIAALTGLDGWLTGLGVLVVLGLTAFFVGWRGVRRLTQIGPPEETIASVKEEIAWAKRLLKRE